MCGFLGQYNTSNLTESEFRTLLALGERRGPDQTGYWEGARIQLGFNRLAILDLTEAGHQPMRSPGGRYMLLFNGEIYNHRALRQKLPPHHYRGHSDTETISHALEAWGIAPTVEALDGMFALAIYDTHSKQLSLARDFAGIKPLFYGLDKGQLVFASQYDQLRAHPLFRSNSINPAVLKLYLKQHFMPAPFGLHQGLHQLHPGEIITFTREGAPQKRRYWELPNRIETGFIQDAGEAQKLFSGAFGQSVSDQLLADVPLGAFLSGGVDSPLVCAYAQKQKAGLSVFSMGSDSKKHDESARATQFAEALQLQQHLWMLDAREMQSYWDEAIGSLHEPLADFSILPTYLISKLAKKHVTVALSGDGGDELFFGYERFWSIGKNRPYQHWPALLRKGLYGADKILTQNKNVNSLLTIARQGQAHAGLHSRFADQWLERIAPGLGEVSLPEEWQVYNYANARDERDLMAQMRKAEFYGMMQKTLRKVDLASMQNSLEVRVPFLQKEVIEAALKIDPLLSYGPNQKKEVLKTNLLRQIPHLPDDNVKRGFTIPLGNWIREGLHEKFSAQFEDLAARESMFNESALKEMLADHVNGRDFKWPLFTLYAFSKL